MNTKDVFSKFKKDKEINPRISDMTAGIYNGNYDIVIQSLYNALEVPAFEMEPTLEQIKNQIRDFGVKSTLMSGSGATIFVICKDKNKLKDLQSVFNDYYFKKLTKIR